MDIDALTSSKIGYWHNGIPPRSAIKFCNDTRELQPGDCFIALSSEERDGHIFLKSAEGKGASCAIVRTPNCDIPLPQFVCQDVCGAVTGIAKFMRKNFNGTVIAITGSFGKTSTKDILKLLLGLKHNTTFENKNNELGVAMTLAALNNSEKFAIVEIGIDTVGAIDDLIALVDPKIAIVTGIGRIHIGGMHSEEIIAHEKCKLIAKTLKRGGQGIFPENCLRFKDFQKFENSCAVARHTGGDFCFSVRDIGKRYEVIVRVQSRPHKFILPELMSYGLAQNFALACICAIRCGVSSEQIQRRISAWRPSILRGEIRNVGDRTYFVDCYNANPTAFEDSLTHFDRLFPHGGRLFVIGALKYSEMGMACEYENISLMKILPLREGDQVIIIADEAEMPINNEMLTRTRCFRSAKEAVYFVRNFRGVVYLKGHRYYKLENLIL